MRPAAPWARPAGAAGRGRVGRVAPRPGEAGRRGVFEAPSRRPIGSSEISPGASHTRSERASVEAWGKWQTVFRLMMPYLGLGTQTLRGGLVHGETSPLGQGATQGPPTLARALLAPARDKPLLARTLDRPRLEPTPDRPRLARTLDRLLALTLLILAPRHLLTQAQLHQDPTQGNQVGLGPTLVPAPLAPLLDHWLCLMTWLSLVE